MTLMPNSFHNLFAWINKKRRKLDLNWLRIELDWPGDHDDEEVDIVLAKSDGHIVLVF